LDQERTRFEQEHQVPQGREMWGSALVRYLCWVTKNRGGRGKTEQDSLTSKGRLKPARPQTQESIFRLREPVGPKLQKNKGDKDEKQKGKRKEPGILS